MKPSISLSSGRNSPLTRILFRFTLVYFAFYTVVSSLLTSLFVLPNVSPGPGLGTVWPLRDITSWVGVHLLGMTPPLVYAGNSRDTDFFWAQLFLVLLLAIATTIIWSVLDRRREEPSIYIWFHLFIRFAVAAQMIYFGMLKVIPTQFPAPSLLTLVAPVGNLSLQGLLWTSIGAAPAYQIATGIVEVIGGVLLVIPQTVRLGAVICLLSMLQVFVLNMTYDVGVKILSFQLVLMSLYLAATPPKHAKRTSLALQIAVGIYLLGAYTSIGRAVWYLDGGGSPKSALYGIWNVEELRMDGETRPAELNDYDRRWRRVIFDNPQWIFFQRTDDSFARYGVNIDTEHRTLSLTKGHSRTWNSVFTFEHDGTDQLVLSGRMDDHDIKAKLRLVPLDTFRLLNSHFRWIRPPDSE